MKSSKQSPGKSSAKSGKFQDRDLCKTSPEKGQEMFKPQGKEPVRMRAKMGGQP